MKRPSWTPATALAALFAVVALSVVLGPRAETGTPFSSRSPGPDGLRLGHDLLFRLGWIPERRDVPFSATLDDPAPIQVLVNARVSARETHALLEFVRGGGSLLIAGEGGALDDSLPLAAIGRGDLVPGPTAGSCDRQSPWMSAIARSSAVLAIGWRRPAPPDTTGFGSILVGVGAEAKASRAAVGYPMGKGLVVGVADAGFLVNDLMTRCELETDVSLVRMIEFLSRGERGRRIQFDEFRHGYGVHGGSFAAIRMYLSDAPSGRMLAQMIVGGLLLLLAFAPRPLDPQDPASIARRSPLEHADALAHAYSSVNATRTATERLLAGVRRRVRRDRSRLRDSNEALLAAAAATGARGTEAGAVISRALDSRLSNRDLPAVAEAMVTVEQALTTRTIPHHR